MAAKPLVIYHANCVDGITAAWVFRCHFGPGGCDFHPATYGEAPPETPGRDVFVVDFSYPRDVMKALILGSRRTVVLDHHKTAEAALVGILEELQQIGQRQPGDRIIFDMERSGAGLAWDYLSQEVAYGGWHRTCPACGASGHIDCTTHPSNFNLHHPGCELARPWLVNYVEDRDLWRLALPGTREVSAYIASLPMTFEEWDTLSATPWKTVADKGAAVQRYIDTYGAKAREMARVEEISGHRVPTINLPYMNCSEHVGALAEEYPDAPFAAGYFRRADGRWQFSLRARAGFDVSEVAKVFGGGGHAGAAGFDVAILPWESR